MGVIYLVRHGQAPPQAYGPGNDCGLTEVGRQQARMAGHALAARVDQLDVAVCGTLPRQRETLEIIMESFGSAAVPTQDPQLNEYDIDAVLGGGGRAAHTASRALQRRVETALEGWCRRDSRSDDIETYNAYQRRSADAFAAIRAMADTGRTVLAVSSSGTITQIIAQLWRLDVKGWIRLSRTMINASITKIIVGDSGASVVSVNEHAHLDIADESGLRALMTFR